MKTSALRRLGRLTLALAWLCGGSPAAFAQTPPPDGSFEELVRRSSVIFAGVVADRSPDTAPAAARQRVLVRVAEVLEAPPFFKSQVGKHVSVSSNAPLETGAALVLFTRGVSVGDTVALEEIGRLTTRDLAALRLRIAATRQLLADRDLAARLDAAELVVVAKVVRTRPVEDAPPRGEHDPRWHEAVLSIEVVLKGAPQTEALLRFPGSNDVAWYGVPKFREGKEGVFILGRTPAAGFFTALSRLDSHPRDQLARIRGLLEAKRTPRGDSP